MDDEKAKLLSIFHTFGNQLEDKSITFRRMAFQPSKTKYNKETILNFLKVQTGQSNIYSMFDDDYYITSIENWKTIAEKDLLNLQKYLQPTLDCDKYARMFQIKVSIIYGLNSCATATGNCIKEDGSTVRHAFNFILAQSNGILNAYIYEPQTDAFKLFKKGDTILDNPKWNYNIDWLYF